LITGKYDLIHCNIASLGLLPIINRKTKRTPIVETFHGFPQWWVESKIMDKVSYAAEFNAIRILSNFANSRTSISNFVRSTILDVLDIDSVVVHNGIESCPLLSPTRKQSRKQFGIDDDTVAVLFVGRLHPAKMPMTLLRAFRVLVEQGRKVKLLVVGDGPLSSLFHREVGVFHLGKFVNSWKYLPWQESLHSIYSAADIFCLPSINEAFGLVLLEAMDHALPLVVSDSGAAPEVAGPAGITFRTGDEIDLVQKLVRLIEDKAMRQELGREGSRRVHENFGLDSMIDGYVRVYEQSLSSV
jgi:glycosyltransferase involved in cell wall biosynthesis